MGLTSIEKIIAQHSSYDIVRPGEIVNTKIDIRVSRDLGGVNLIRNLKENGPSIYEPQNTFFTFDFYSTSDPSIIEFQQTCRTFARENGIKIFDIHTGIGSHIMIDQGYATPGTILASTDTHANILGAIGALGIGLNEKDIYTAFTKGFIWYRVPKSIKIKLNGQLNTNISAKDLALNLLSIIGPTKYLGYAIDLSGPVIDQLTLDGRITLASMANEFGVVSFFMPPNQEVLDYCFYKSNQNISFCFADEDADYDDYLNIDASRFVPMISNPGQMELMPVDKILNKGIDSAFIGTCTNGRIEDLRVVAGILKGRKVAPGVIFKIVPSTDEIWTLALQEGLIDIFKEAGALVTSAGCGGCASGQYIRQSFGEATICSGNKNFIGLSNKGDVYLASPAIVAASAIAGYITTPNQIPDKPYTLLSFPGKTVFQHNQPIKNTIYEGNVWHIPYDNIDTDKIYNSRYTKITDLSEFGSHTFLHLEGYEYFASQVKPGDIIIVGENFGLGNSSNHAIDCFKSLGIQAIIAKSFAGVYEHNAVRAGLPVIVCSQIDSIEPQTGDMLRIDIHSGTITNLKNNKSILGEKFSGMDIKSTIQETI